MTKLSDFDQRFLKAVGIPAWLPDDDDEPVALVLPEAPVKTVPSADLVFATDLMWERAMGLPEGERNLFLQWLRGKISAFLDPKPDQFGDVRLDE